MVSDSTSNSNSRANSSKKKIDIKLINNSGKLQVCFSKRRNGLFKFKKATDLVTLCGAEILLVVFSPAGRPYTMGMPDVDFLLDRLLEHEKMPADPWRARHSAAVVWPLYLQFMEVKAQLDVMRGQQGPRARYLKECAMAAGLVGCGLDFDLDGMRLPEMHSLRADLTLLTPHISNYLRSTRFMGRQSSVMVDAVETGGADGFCPMPISGTPRSVKPLPIRGSNRPLFPRFDHGSSRNMGPSPALNLPNDVWALSMPMQQADADAGDMRFMGRQSSIMVAGVESISGDGFYPIPDAGASSSVNPMQMTVSSGPVFPRYDGSFRNTVQPAGSSGDGFRDAPAQDPPFMPMAVASSSLIPVHMGGANGPMHPHHDGLDGIRALVPANCTVFRGFNTVQPAVSDGVGFMNVMGQSTHFTDHGMGWQGRQPSF